jgi:hypothetical protein
MSPEEHQQRIYVKDIQGRRQEIPQLPTNKAQKLLGVMKCPIGDQQAEIARLRAKSDNYARRINSNSLTRSEARLAYDVFYIPAIRYSLNITAINQTDLENIQAKATAAFLAAQGYNRNMPREVVYAPALYQGVGMRHLYDIQGSDCTRLLLQELNNHGSTTERMITAVLEIMQLESGIGRPILEDCRPLDYIEWGWIPQIRDFLHHINGQIVTTQRRPKTYREHDTYLMDSEYLSRITQRERIYINRCRLHLQVATISDIATADGLQIHNTWKRPDTRKPSRSTLRWPRQDSPNRTAWKAWEKFLQSFITPSGKLRISLGRWNGHTIPRLYNAYVNHGNDMLWISNGGNYDGHPMRATRRKVITFHATATTEAKTVPPHAIPTEELGRSNEDIRVRKPSTSIPKRRQSEQTKLWYKRSPPHLSHIIGDIDITSNEIIQRHLSNESRISAASDGGHDPDTGISTFGWTVALGSEVIARGRGPTQSHPELAESFRSEGYGLTSVANFLQNLITEFSIDLQKYTVKIYLDNKSLIQRMSSFREQIRVARWNLRPDEDIVLAAYKALQHLPVTLEHVRSHQDQRNKETTLPFAAILNIAADEEATRQRNRMSEPASNVQNIWEAQLRLNDIAITRDSQRWIMRTAGRIPIQQYYQERYGWNEKTFQNISWQSQAAVLRSYPTEDQTRIIKFAHGWLPTQNRRLKEGAANNAECRLCKNTPEDNLHLFGCEHREMKKHQEKLASSIRQGLQDHGNSELANLIELAISESCTGTQWHPDMKHISTSLAAGIRDQTTIGWQHLYTGRLSKTLISTVDDHYKMEGIHGRQYSGERWARQLIKLIWDTMLSLWKERNAIINQRDSQEMTTALREQREGRVQRCFDFSHQLKHNERTRWFSKTIQEVLGQEAKNIDAWLTAVERLIRITKREQRQRPKNSIIMERFLNMNRQQSSKPTSANQKPQKYIQELKPD